MKHPLIEKIDPRLFAGAVAALALSACGQGGHGSASAANNAEKTADYGDGLIEVEHEVADQVRVGEQAVIRFQIENVSDQTLRNVRLIPASMSAASQSQQSRQSEQAGSQKKENQLNMGNAIAIGTLQAGQTAQAEATFRASTEGETERCFAVDYEPVPAICASVNIVQPELVFNREFLNEDGNPVDQAYACDEITVVYYLENRGTGTTDPVTITEQLPEGMQIDGSRQVQIDVDALEADESWEEQFDLEAQGTVDYQGTAIAETQRQRLASDQATVSIVEPQISLRLQGTQQTLVDRAVDYRVTVSNDSEVASPGTVVAIETDGFDEDDLQFADGVEFEDGAIEFGTLEPGQTREFSFTASYEEPGRYGVMAEADGYCVADTQQARAQVRTQVEGVAALQLEMIDREDPVDQGETTAYRVRVTNEGSARDTDVGVQVTLPDGLEFVEGDGATEIQSQGQAVQFGRLRNMEPGKTAEWTVQVRAAGSGDVLTSAEMTSNALPKPLIERESTRLIGEN
ncbi:MAG: hypothetical protein ACFB21_07385 [Opitutales bacterium]